MIKCFCPSCGLAIKADFFIPSKVKLECKDCKMSLLITAKEKEIVIKYPIINTSGQCSKRNS